MVRVSWPILNNVWYLRLNPAMSWSSTTSRPITSQGCVKPSRPRTRRFSTCRNTRPTSTQSNWPLPSSKLSCARPPNDPFAVCGAASPPSSPASSPHECCKLSQARRLCCNLTGICSSTRGTDSGTSRVALGRPGYSPLAPHQHHDQRRKVDEGDGNTDVIDPRGPVLSLFRCSRPARGSRPMLRQDSSLRRVASRCVRAFTA